MFIETHTRSVAKSLSWRLTATLTTILLVYLFTGTMELALAIGGVEVIAKMLIYFFHERAWNNVRFGRAEVKPSVIWFTGLSGSGKTTIAKRLHEKLLAKGLRVERLDGDQLREILPGTGFSKEDRDAHVKRVGLLASMLQKNGIFVIASLVSPYREARSFVRDLCDRFVEVYTSTPLEECEKRDVKGLYAKARQGQIKNFTGISDPYEAPQSPELIFDTRDVSVDEAVDQIIAHISSKKMFGFRKQNKSQKRNDKPDPLRLAV